MKFLLDTNIIIPLEPTSPSDRKALTQATVKLVCIAAECGHQVYRHPSINLDMKRDNERERAELRSLLLQKYPPLPDPPKTSPELVAIIGSPTYGTNNWVDNQLLAALRANAVDFLITEDQGIHKKSRRLNLSKRVLGIAEAIALILDLSEKVPSPPPAVRVTKLHDIKLTDPIFESFREDYKNFDPWFERCCLEHRQTWVIDDDKGAIAGFCIVNSEKSPPTFLTGRVLKLCSFKVSEYFSGRRFGELLLKAIFEHAFQNGYDWIFVTVFEKHGHLIQLFEDFGFCKTNGVTSLGEIILAKPLKPDASSEESLDPLDFHVRYGPQHFKTASSQWYTVPIQPRWANLLFPESAAQTVMFPGQHPFGNSIRKAYLCNSAVHSMAPGSILAFYQSTKSRGIMAIGIVEETLVSRSDQEVIQFVGKRTVYSEKEIRSLCQRSNPAMAILFRQARVILPAISVDSLMNGKVFKRPPQSIITIKEEGQKWIQAKLDV